MQEYKCTHCLSELELTRLVPMISQLLEQATSIRQAVNERDMMLYLAQKGHYANIDRMRRIIAHIRINNIVPYIVSSPRGYYVADNHIQVMEQVTRLRTESDRTRIEANALEEQLNINFH